MTIEECYKKLHGDYEGMKSRIPSDRLIEKFMLKFLADDSMDILRHGIEEKNSEECFRGVHTLKGVAANLSFEGLRLAASELTEQLRGTTDLPREDLLLKLEESYKLVIDTLETYQNEKA